MYFAATNKLFFSKFELRSRYFEYFRFQQKLAKDIKYNVIETRDLQMAIERLEL